MEGEDLNKLLDRYEAVKARADRCEGPEQEVARNLLRKMETKHPGLGEFFKKREEAARFREMFQKQTGMDPWGENWQEASRAANGETAPPAYNFVDKVLWKAMGWATKNLQEMMSEEEDSQPFPDPPPRPPDTEPWVEPTPRSLLEEISAEVETETSAYREKGEDVVEVTLWFPRRLWERIVREKEGGSLLVRWVARVMEEGR
jgi:hypothetical protein